MADLETSSVMPRVITFLSSLLQRVADSNDFSSQFIPHKVSVFHGLARPSISIQDYLERIYQYANCSPSCYVVAYVYLDRFVQKQPSFLINSLNVHRLIITSVLISAKFMDDISYNNAYYAKIGGISTAEMNVLEVDFLFGLGFQLNVTPTTFHTYNFYLHKEMLMQTTPLSEPSMPQMARSPKFHYYLNEDESTTHQKQLAV